MALGIVAARPTSSPFGNAPVAVTLPKRHGGATPLAPTLVTEPPGLGLLRRDPPGARFPARPNRPWLRRIHANNTGHTQAFTP
jgi:hypothetical protein